MNESFMDPAELREAARKLAYITEAGCLDRFAEVLMERLDEHRDDLNRQKHVRDKPGTFLPLVDHLTRYLDVSQEQAEAAAVDACLTTPRSIALDLLDEAFHKVKRSRRAS